MRTHTHTYAFIQALCLPVCLLVFSPILSSITRDDSFASVSLHFAVSNSSIYYIRFFYLYMYLYHVCLPLLFMQKEKKRIAVPLCLSVFLSRL